MRIHWFTGLVVVAIVGVACGEDWPQFGGTSARNMVSNEKGFPDTLVAGANDVAAQDPAAKEPGAKGNKKEAAAKEAAKDAGGKEFLNLKWTAKLGNNSFGTPTIAEGLVLVGTNNNPPRDARYKGDRGVLLCLEEKTGNLVWSLPVPKSKTVVKSFDHLGLGLCSSPFIQDHRAYFMSSSCQVVCVDMLGMANGNDGTFKDEAAFLNDGPLPKNAAVAKDPTGPRTDADIIWKYDCLAELKITPHDSTDCSPLLVGDTLFVCSNNGVNGSHKVSDNPEAPTMLAFNAKTGELLGTDDCLINHNVFHGNWCNPTLGEVNGKPAVLFGGGDGMFYAFDPEVSRGADGKPGIIKKLWSVDANPPDHRAKSYHSGVGPSEVIGTPAFVDGKIYFTVGQDPNHGQGIGNLSCLDPNTGKVIWNDPTIHRSLCSVSIANGLLFVGDFSGFVHCYDAKTGKKFWEHDSGAAIWGSSMVADGKVYIGNSRGTLMVFAASQEKKLISENRFGSPIKSSPVIANGTLYIMTESNLYAFSQKTAEAKPPEAAAAAAKP